MKDALLCKVHIILTDSSYQLIILNHQLHFFFSEDEFEVDPLSLKSIINSEGMTPVRVTAPVRKTLAGPIFRQVSTCRFLL